MAAPVRLLMFLLTSGCCSMGGGPPPLPDFISRWVNRANVIQARSQPYSSHVCYNLAELPMHRSQKYVRTGGYRHVCLLHNVCVDPSVSRGHIQYYEDTAAVGQAGSASPKFFDNGTHTDFPPFTFCDREQAVVQISKKPFPSQPFWMTPSIYALVCPQYCTYFSHFWVDNVVPYFWGAQVVGAYDPQQFGLLWTSRLHPVTTDQKCPCRPFFAKWLWPSGMVANNSLCQLPNSRLTMCFENLIVGAQAFAFCGWPLNALSGLGPAYAAVRDIVRHGVAGLRPDDAPRRQAVLIIRKLGRRRILNVDALKEHLRLCFPGLPVSITTMDLPAAEQVWRLNNATVVVAPSGTVAYSALFMHRHSVLIQVDRYMPSTQRSVPTDQYVFMNAGVRFMAYDVNPAEIRIETHGMKFAKRANADWQYNGFGSVAINTLRMARMVFWALKTVEDTRQGNPAFHFARGGLQSAACQSFRPKGPRNVLHRRNSTPPAPSATPP
eukprot:EG_transcript_8210